VSVYYVDTQYFGPCDHCGVFHRRGSNRRWRDRPLSDEIGPADVVTGREESKLCRRCWWRARGANGWEPTAAEWLVLLARETFPGSTEL
jgi:hypothetical protein